MAVNPDQSPVFRNLAALIEFPSVSTTSNVECSRWVERRLQDQGFETEWLTYRDQNDVEKVCVAGCLRPASPATCGSGLAYFCHTDVVPVDSWSFAASGPWQAHQVDGKIYGRGSCDMKGSLACLLTAISKMEQPVSAPLYVFCTADEEVGFFGAKKVAAESKLFEEVVQQQLNAVIGEPTELQVVHAHKGGRILKFTAHGRAAHSSTTEGINANFLMIPFLYELRQLVEQLEADPRFQDDRFEPPGITLNLILNDHTPAVNMTPAVCDATVYFRTMPGINAKAISDRLRELANRHRIQIDDVGGGEPVFTDPKTPFVHQLLALSGTTESQTVSYGTDGGCFAELNNIAIFGPGSIKQAHTDDEFITVAQLDQGVRLYGKLIAQNCCQPSQ